MITYLVKKNILKLVQQKTILFLIILISFAVSVFGVLFYSGYFAYSYYDSLKGEVCSVEVLLRPLTSSENVREIISDATKLSPEAVISVIAADGDINNNYVPGNTIPIIGKYSTFEKEQVLLGRYFDKNENEAVVLLSEMCASIIGIPNSPIAKIITIGQKDFSIVGVLFNSELAYILPLDYYIDNYPVTKISVLYNQNISFAEMQSINKEHSDSIADYTFVKQKSPFLSISFLPSLIQILLVYSFTFINILLVILLWQQCCLEQYKIYYICGIQEKQLFFTILFQIINTSLIGIIIGLVSYIGLLPLFESLSIVRESLFDCLIIVGIIVMIVIVFSAIYSKKTVRRLGTYKKGGI